MRCGERPSPTHRYKTCEREAPLGPLNNEVRYEYICIIQNSSPHLSSGHPSAHAVARQDPSPPVPTISQSADALHNQLSKQRSTGDDEYPMVHVCEDTSKGHERSTTAYGGHTNNGRREGQEGRVSTSHASQVTAQYMQIHDVESNMAPSYASKTSPVRRSMRHDDPKRHTDLLYRQPVQLRLLRPPRRRSQHALSLSG